MRPPRPKRRTVVTDVEPGPALRWPQVLSVLVAVLAWVLIALGLIGLIARHVVSAWHPLIIAAVMLPLLTVGVLLAAVGFGVTRRWIPLALAVLLLLVLAAPPVRILLRSGSSQTGVELTVMTSNMRLGEANPEQLLAAARAHGVQLLMVQELSRPALTRLQSDGIGQEFKYSYTRAQGGGSGIGLFSAFPLTEEHSYPDFWLQVISARISLDGGRSVTVFSSHLSAPYPDAAARWVADSHRLGQVLAATPGTVIDAGDFNATVNLKAFRQLVSNGHVTDGASSIGALIRTYPADKWYGPVLGIDHMLLRGVSARSMHTVQIDNTDHRAVVGKLTVQ